MRNNKRRRIAPVVHQRSRELHQPLTPAEEKIWQLLRNRNLGGHKFLRQHPIGHLIVDYYCAEAKLVVDIDGDIHRIQEEYDVARTEWLQTHGYAVIRFQNDVVLNSLDDVKSQILSICESLMK